MQNANMAGLYRNTVREFLISNFYISDLASLRDETSLLDTGIIDSTGVLEVIGFLEASFGITIEDRELLPENLDSIQGIVNFVDRKKRGLAVTHA